MDLLYTLLVLLAITRLFGEVAVRFKQQALVGELLGGVLVGAVVHAHPAWFPTLSGLGDDPEFRAVTDLGVFFLMLLAGLEMKPRELTRGSGTSIAVAFGGLLVPLALGFGLGMWFLPDSPYRLAQALFLGTAVAITAVPVAIRILMDLGQLERPIGKTVVAAALIDDVLSLILLSVLTALLQTGELMQIGDLVWLLAKIAGFFAITTAIGLYALPRLRPMVERLLGSEIELSLLMLVGLGFAVLAELLSMHFIIGAFVAGLFFSARTLPARRFESVQAQISGLTKGVLAPIFFASIGLHLDLGALVAVPLFLSLVLLISIVGKVVGAGGAAAMLGMPLRSAASVGVAMSARGAVELIIAEVALRAGLFEHPKPVPPIVANMFSTAVVMAIVTTLLAPVVLPILLPRNSSGEKSGDNEASDEERSREAEERNREDAA